MADQEDGLLRRGDARLQDELRGDVEEVVGLVEQQHRRVGPENSTSSTSRLRSPPRARSSPARRRRRTGRGRSAGTPRPTGPRARSRRAPTSRRSPRRAACPRPPDPRPRPARAPPPASARPRRAGAPALPPAAARARSPRCRGRRRRPAACRRTCRYRRRRRRPAAARRGHGTASTCRPRSRPRARRAGRTHLERDLREQQLAARMGVGEVGDDDVRHARSLREPLRPGAQRPRRPRGVRTVASAPAQLGRISLTTPGPRYTSPV